jgi:glutathione reductase (NADPH)
MPPITQPTQEKYDYVIIGGGSGASGTGVRSFPPRLLHALSNEPTPQRRAASYGKKVAVIEATGVLGGCCVKVGKYPFPPREQD